MSNIILAAHNISKAYSTDGVKRVMAVGGVSLEVKKGESLCIAGPSGAGKSTLLHLLGGLDSPTAGKVMLDGVDIYRLPDGERSRIRNKRIGFVFQSYHLLPEFSALENVMLPAMIAGGRAEKKARGILKAIGLEDRADHRPGELSGGESQRVAIARALINDPEILLCDEPTGNLDSVTSETIYQLIFDIKSISRAAIVIVTHDENLSKRTDSLIRIKDGRIV